MSVEGAFGRLRAEKAGTVKRDEPLARHTTFRIGGPAALFIECDTLHDLVRATEILAEEDVAFTVLGRGSNVLAADAGYDGAVLVLGTQFKRRSLEGGQLRAGAGIALATLVQLAFKSGVTGLEFAVGVPGTLGGALAMNAGSRETWMSSVVETVTVFVPGEGLCRLGAAEVAWGYRRTSLPSVGVIVEASVRLREGDAAQIRRTMEASLRRRKRTQPLGARSAGSVFVNPEGDSAGRLIEATGLKGAAVGGARVSDVHANFIINAGGASADDVLALIRRIQDAVRDAHGVELRPEIRFLGSFESP